MEYNKQQKNSIITFVQNQERSEARFTGEEIVFSIPYSRIIEASLFCEREKLDLVFIGFKNKTWQTEISNKEFEYFITVTANGISPDTASSYVYTITPF